MPNLYIRVECPAIGQHADLGPTRISFGMVTVGEARLVRGELLAHLGGRMVGERIDSLQAYELPIRCVLADQVANVLVVLGEVLSRSVAREPRRQG